MWSESLIFLNLIGIIINWVTQFFFFYSSGGWGLIANLLLCFEIWTSCSPVYTFLEKMGILNIVLILFQRASRSWKTRRGSWDPFHLQGFLPFGRPPSSRPTRRPRPQVSQGQGQGCPRQGALRLRDAFRFGRWPPHHQGDLLSQVGNGQEWRFFEVHIVFWALT